MNRRLLALVLTLCMVFSLLSGGAWAAAAAADASQPLDKGTVQTERAEPAEEDGFDEVNDGDDYDDFDGNDHDAYGDDDDYDESGDYGDDDDFNEPEPDQVPNTITCQDSFERTVNTKKNQTFRLKASANGAPLSYKSSNKKNVWLDNDTVTVKQGFVGKADITISSAETEEYYAAEKKVTVTVNPSGTGFTSASQGKKAWTVNLVWKKNTTGKGYLIEYSTDKKFKKNVKKQLIGKNGTEKTTIKVKFKDLKAGTAVYFRIRTVNGKLSSGWSKSKSVKVK